MFMTLQPGEKKNYDLFFVDGVQRPQRATEPLRGGSLIFTTNYYALIQNIYNTHFAQYLTM